MRFPAETTRHRPPAVRLTRRGRRALLLLLVVVFFAAFMAGATDVCWQPTGGYGTCAP